MPTTQAVVLARGLGTRMRRPDPSAAHDAAQARAADAGLKSMIPIGRPFLDYVLSSLADAGIERACLVIGPEHDTVREHYGHRHVPERLTVRFAIQVEPRGTADAVLAAEAVTAGDPFLVLNSDNHYPVAALEALRATDAPALAAFEREDLVRSSGIDPARVRQFAVLDVDDHGFLKRVVEKPSDEEYARVRPPVLVSMNCWAFDATIFDACRSVRPSPRGELELTAAVNASVAAGARVRVIPAPGPVLDLSTRADIATVAARLAPVEVRL